MAATLLFFMGVSHAKNPDISYWMANVSESARADELGEADYPAEMVVAGQTIHTLWITRKTDWTGYKLFYRRSLDNLIFTHT